VDVVVGVGKSYHYVVGACVRRDQVKKVGVGVVVGFVVTADEG
jgi:hypothetical protein